MGQAVETTNIPITEVSSTKDNFKLDLASKSPDPLEEFLKEIPDTIEKISIDDFELNYMQPSCSHILPNQVLTNKTSFEQGSPGKIMPIPQLSKEKNSMLKRKSKLRGRTVVLTESPYKNERIEKQSQTKVKQEIKSKAVKVPEKLV